MPWANRAEARLARHPYLASLVAGALLAQAFAPYDQLAVLFLSLPLFLSQLMRASTLRQAARIGFCFGFGFYLAGTWWIMNALLVDAAQFAWLVPFSLLGISGVMALWFVLFALAFARLRGLSDLGNILLFGALWVLVEYLRSLGALGFPWNLLGYASLAHLPLAQAASVIGVYGLSFVLALAGVAPVCGRAGGRVRHLAWGAPLLLLATLEITGILALRTPTAFTSTRLAVVQPNIPQEIKGTPQGLSETIAILRHLPPLAEAAPPADLAIWPETALPTPIINGDLRGLQPRGGVLLSGAVLADGGTTPGEALRIYNGLIAVDPAGKLIARYEKHQLVPFGEFVPLRDVLPLSKITPGALDFSRGVGPVTLPLPGDIPLFQPLICFEAIFPWAAEQGAGPRAQWLLNVTNDAWYGDTAGPYQHFAMSRMRAIEQGLPLVRAANNGISAIVDPWGRVLQQTHYGARAVLRGPLPQARAVQPHLAARQVACFALLLIGLIVVRTRQNMPEESSPKN